MTAANLPSPPPFRPLLVLLIIIACLYQSVGSLRRGGSNAVRLRDKRWHCHREDGRCVVDSATSSVDSGDDNSVYPHLEGCKSVCGKHGSLWPIPKKVKLSATLNAFKLEDIAVKVKIRFTNLSKMTTVDLPCNSQLPRTGKAGHTCRRCLALLTAFNMGYSSTSIFRRLSSME